jgi:ABC-type uncharacterized transport system permease subunit
MERWILVLTVAFLLASFAYTVFALGRGRFRPGRFNFSAIAAAFATLSFFLYDRGQAVGSCPLGTVPDVLAFLGWSILLIYLGIGSTYRLSLLGAFTGPLVLLLLLVSLAAPHPPDVSLPGPPDPWVELHAALSVVAYGAFALAAVAGGMYLIQERQLKHHKVSTLFYNLPPISDLSRVNGRLIALGFIMLTVAFVAGLLSQRPVDGMKLWASLIIWALYGTLYLRRHRHKLSPRAQSLWSLWFFVFIIFTLPWVHYLSTSSAP